MEIIQLSIDTQSYSVKPNKLETISINNRIPKNPQEISVEDFARLVVIPNGYSWSGAVFKQIEGVKFGRNNHSWSQQQAFALDFDNGIKFSDVLDRCRFNRIQPTFAYSTFSSCEELEKFRVVFITPEVIRDKRVQKAIVLALMDLFPECDKACKDACRLFFGGKEIIYENYHATLDVPNLVDGMCSYQYFLDRSHSARKISAYCKECQIDITENGVPKVIRGNNYDLVNLTQNLYIYNSSCAELTKNYSITFNDSLHFGKSHSPKTKSDSSDIRYRKNAVRDFDWDKLEQECQLYREFANGTEWLYYPELWGIMSNMICIQGGQKKFITCLGRREEYEVNKWQANLTYSNKREYLPQRCENFCPYADSCNHPLNMIQIGKVYKGRITEFKSPKAISLADAEKELEEIFNRFLRSKKKQVSVIKAPTAIGKTELYLTLKGVTIALPNHDLINDVANRMTASGRMDFIVIPPLPEGIHNKHKAKIDHLYRVGANAKASAYVRKLAKENNDPILLEYIETIDSVKKVEGITILTTHERLIYLEDNNDTIIIDEDIVPTMLNQGIVDVRDILNLSHFFMIMPEDGEKLRELMGLITDNNSAVEMPDNPFKDLERIENIVINESCFNSNIIGFLKCDYFTGEPGGSQINFVGKRQLPDKKILIMSATADEDIYNRLFRKPKVYDLGYVESEGKIEQYPQYSCSRYQLENLEGLEDLAKYIIGDLPVITFLKFKDDFKNPIDEMHFGKSTGFDTYNGKDIAVVGTPHFNQSVYMLYAKALGIEIKPSDFDMKYVKVRRNNFEFYFNCLCQLKSLPPRS